MALMRCVNARRNLRRRFRVRKTALEREQPPLQKRRIAWGVMALVLVALAGFGGWMLSLPAPVAPAAQPVPPDEMAAIIAQLKPPKRQRPVIAIVGLNDATETTDYLMPPGILRRADIADVRLLATAAGPVKLFPTLTVEPDETIAEFDARTPQGADYVIVPQMSRADDPVVLGWLRDQAKRERRLWAFAPAQESSEQPDCSTTSARRPTGFTSTQLRDNIPSMIYVRDRRVVADRRSYHDNGNHGIDAGRTHADRGHCWSREGASRSGRSGFKRLGCQPRQFSRFKLTRPIASHGRPGMCLPSGIANDLGSSFSREWTRFR